MRALRISVTRSDQVLDGVGAVGIGRVDVGDAVLVHRGTWQRDHAGRVSRRAPRAGPVRSADG